MGCMFWGLARFTVKWNTIKRYKESANVIRTDNHEGVSLFIDPCLLFCYLIFSGAAQRYALPALGRGRRSRPARKRLRLEKCLRFSPESPASGACFVGLLYDCTGTMFSRGTFRVLAMADRTSIEPVRLLVSNCDKYGTLIPAFSANSC